MGEDGACMLDLAFGSADRRRWRGVATGPLITALTEYPFCRIIPAFSASSVAVS
jgi:hypothetical protein